LGILLFIGSFYLAVAFHPLWLISSLLIFIGFYFLVKKHEVIRNTTTQLGFHKAFYKNELGILRGSKSAYYNGDAYIQNSHPYTEDLDVFGSFSLFSLLNRAATSLGIEALKDSFLLQRETEASEIQDASKEIAAKKAWHEDFLSTLFPLIEFDKSKTQAVFDFSFDDKIKNEKLILVYSKLIPYIWISIIVIGYFISLNWAIGMGVILFLLNFRIVGMYKDLSEAYFTRIEGIFRTLQPIEESVELIVSENWSSKKNNELQALIPTKDKGKNPIKEFGFLVKKLESRRNQFATIFLYLYSPFDVIQLVKLKRWNEANGGFFKDILTVIGEFEVLASFAMCASNHQDWTFPTLTNKAPFELKGIQLGHPLLLEGNVRNDFDFNPKNRLSLVTGSNMSGKSTFLRSIGTNVLLAYMGAPVCAEKMTISKGIEMITYMRIKDDLNLNVSTFKAEINRVKMIVEAIENGGNYLFLIDEMLRGTNSEDKLKGAIALLRKIANSHTYAIVATHDLRATEVSDEYPEVIKNYFFEFKNVDDDLEFDYKVKAGVCQSFNASQLLRKAGLDV
jgi:hypothetical protein